MPACLFCPSDQPVHQDFYLHPEGAASFWTDARRTSTNLFKVTSGVTASTESPVEEVASVIVQPPKTSAVVKMVPLNLYLNGSFSYYFLRSALCSLRFFFQRYF